MFRQKTSLENSNYLTKGEDILHEVDGCVQLDDKDGFLAYLTPIRIMFLKQKGLVFKKQNFVDIYLRDLIGAEMNEKGLLRKKRHLELKTINNTVKVFGKDTQVLDFHKKITEQLIKIKR